MSNQNLYPQSSPYYNSSIVDNKFLDVMINRPIPMDPSDVHMIITSVYEYRPDLLAYDLYGDSKLWWVFAKRNPNRLGEDPYFNFKAGVGIYIPRLGTLKTVLGI
jgi:hypothetical protein